MGVKSARVGNYGGTSKSMTDTAQQEWNDNIQWEKDTHEQFFLPFYKEMGWQVLADNVGTNTPWDVKLMIDGKERTIDQKALKTEKSAFVLEIIQDLKTGSLSWLYKDKDEYMYASWKSKEEFYTGNQKPLSLYRVSHGRLKKLLNAHWKEIVELGRFYVALKGIGATLCMNLRWDYLIQEDIAKKLI